MTRSSTSPMPSPSGDWTSGADEGRGEEAARALLEDLAFDGRTLGHLGLDGLDRLHDDGPGLDRLRLDGLRLDDDGWVDDGRRLHLDGRRGLGTLYRLPLDGLDAGGADLDLALGTRALDVGRGRLLGTSGLLTVVATGCRPAGRLGGGRLLGDDDLGLARARALDRHGRGFGGGPGRRLAGRAAFRGPLTGDRRRGHRAAPISSAGS